MIYQKYYNSIGKVYYYKPCFCILWVTKKMISYDEYFHHINDDTVLRTYGCVETYTILSNMFNNQMNTGIYYEIKE